MRSVMESYSKREYVDLAAHGYRMLADAIEAGHPYTIDCPVLLLCGEKDRAGNEDGRTRMVLDTGRPLEAAVSLYRKLGFQEIEPYYANPMDDVVCFGREL